MHRLRVVGLIFQIALFVLIGLTRPVSAETTYSFGIVPQFEAMRLASVWMPILEHLEATTPYKFRMVGSPDIPSFETEFQEGEFDFAYMNPYHAIMAQKAQGYDPIIRDGGRELFGILAVSKTSDIQEINDLNGSTIAFPAPNALGASLLMRADLTNRFGLQFEPLYASTHSSAYLNLVLGRVAAAGGVMGTFRRQPDDIKDQLTIIYETTRVAPHPIVTHPRVPQDVRDAVQSALLRLGETEEGRAILAPIPIREIRKASAADYAPLLAMGLEDFLE
ncbi:MAG: phosphate/phosphite/phosphonate ABC transporter substrate-binding protein [Mangrovicoccus sp.]